MMLLYTQQAGLGLIGWIIVCVAFYFIADQIKGKKKKDDNSENNK